MTHYPGMSLKKEEFYKPEDLLLGETVKIHGRICRILNCDGFTKDWYRENLGINQDAAPIK